MSSTSIFSNFEYWLMEGFWNKNGDPRLREFSFMNSFRLATAILACYVLFVTFLGPRWMKNRKPFSLKPILLVYNVNMALFNGYFFGRMLLNYTETFPRMFNTTFPSITDTSGWHMEIIEFNYLYVISKYVDLLDTVFFVLRKKQSQITALHLYHHFTVAFFAWVTFRLCAICNVAAPFAFMNSFIHVLMYSYYALAAQGPQMQPYLWWKRYLTQIQIGQFVVLFAHSVYFVSTQQGYSSYYKYNYGFNTVVYLVLFTRFYAQTYSKRREAKEMQLNNNKEIKSQ